MGENKACTISCLQNCSCVHGTDNEKLTAPYMARPRAIELSMRLRTKKRKFIPSLQCFPLKGNVFHAAHQADSFQCTSNQCLPPSAMGIPSAALRDTLEQPEMVTDTKLGEAEANAATSPPSVIAPHSIKERCCT